MTPEQIEDKKSVWDRMSVEHPEFRPEHDPTDNYHAVREIILGGSVTWKAANAFFQPFPGARVMDVGANAGIFGTYCALHYSLVTAYEPNPEIYRKFSEMATREKLLRYLNPVQAAIWTYTGRCPYLGHKSEGEDVTRYNGGLLTDGVAWTQEDADASVTVDCVSFDDALGRRGDWDCVKMDIEGAEFEVLLATPDEALARIRFMYLELHPWASQELYERTIDKLKRVFRCQFFPFEGVERSEAAYLFQK